MGSLTFPSRRYKLHGKRNLLDLPFLLLLQSVFKAPICSYVHLLVARTASNIVYCVNPTNGQVVSYIPDFDFTTTRTTRHRWIICSARLSFFTATSTTFNITLKFGFTTRRTRTLTLFLLRSCCICPRVRCTWTYRCFSLLATTINYTLWR